MFGTRCLLNNPQQKKNTSYLSNAGNRRWLIPIDKRNRDKRYLIYFQFHYLITNSRTISILILNITPLSMND